MNQSLIAVMIILYTPNDPTVDLKLNGDPVIMNLVGYQDLATCRADVPAQIKQLTDYHLTVREAVCNSVQLMGCRAEYVDEKTISLVCDKPYGLH